MAFSRRFQSFAIAGILAAGITCAGALETTARADSTYPIGVTVDGNRVNFTGTQPMEVHGSVLVPLRGVFEALGAGVDYDSSTNTVRAEKDGRQVVVPIGSTTATINGQPQQLSQPATIYNGSTMVPLRFVAEALGDYVEWGSQTHMVSIISSTPPPTVASVPPPDYHSAPPPDYHNDYGSVTGVVRSVATGYDTHQIVVRVNGVDREFRVRNDAEIIRGRAGRDGMAVALTDLQPGDRVTIRRSGDGDVVRIASTFGMVYGTVSTIERRGFGRRIIVLNDGQSIELAPNARVMRDGVEIAAMDLNTGDHVSIKTDPEDNIAYRVQVDQPINAHRR